MLRNRNLDVRAIGDTWVRGLPLGQRTQDGSLGTAQLIDAATGYHIWSDEYNRDLEDIFAVQEQIARAIAGALDLRLASGGEATRASRMPDLEAYDLYLRGLYLRNSLTADALRQAMEYFDRAIELEPGFAPAYAAKASVVALEPMRTWSIAEWNFRPLLKAQGSIAYKLLVKVCRRVRSVQKAAYTA